jgi:GTP pyrophosphokinase
VPLDYKLKNGDIVEIVTTKIAHGPSRDWMKIVATNHAREKIRQWFKRQQRDENIVHGRESLDRELRRLARSSLEKVGPERVAEMAEAYRYPSVDDFYAAIGYGALGAQQVVMRMGVADDADEVVLPTTAPPIMPARTGGVRVKGLAGVMTRFAGCCQPVPGDPIIGYVTRGRGVTVHLPTCPTVVNEKDVARLIDVEWEGQVAQAYPISIRIEAYDRTGLLNEITNVVAENKVNIVAANIHVNPDQTATMLVTLQVSSVAQLAKVLSRIEQLRDVYSVSRDLS